MPPAAETWNYAGSFADGKFLVSAIGPLQAVPPAGSATFSSKLFIGPKLQSELEDRWHPASSSRWTTAA